jgi:ubiquitin carboxyl-terminal hydrolase L5
MDGLKQSPVALGRIPDDGEWIEIAKPAIQKRIEKYSSNEIRFNLMAIVRNRKKVLMETIEKLRSLPPSQQTEASISALNLEIVKEDEKNKQWKAENIRRKHNYFPFIATLIKCLAESGHLEPLLKNAIENEKLKKKKNVGNQS